MPDEKLKRGFYAPSPEKSQQDERNGTLFLSIFLLCLVLGIIILAGVATNFHLREWKFVGFLLGCASAVIATALIWLVGLIRKN